MPIDARTVSVLSPVPPGQTAADRAADHFAAIDRLLASPWSESELEDSDNGGDHDRKTAGRFYDPVLLDREAKAVLVRTYESMGWRVRTSSSDRRLLFAPAAKIRSR